MRQDLLTETDVKQLDMSGITPDKARVQIDFLQNGVRPLKLNRPCRIGDGIAVIAEEELLKMIELHDEAAREGRLTKFVPASGAASRMFTHWHAVLAKSSSHTPGFEKAFAENLHKFAFFQDLKGAVSCLGEDVETLLKNGELHHILHEILMPKGLNYGHLPKAMIKFHAYKEGNRTPLEEHLTEAAFFTTDAQGASRIHFTVSEEHLKQITSFLAEIQAGYERKLGVKFRISLSTQTQASNTIAMEGEKLYRDRSGRLFLRPGGHGALLDNLNNIDGDIIFIKNIDNVVPDRLKPEGVFYKKVLGGYFLSLEKEIFRHLRSLSKGEKMDGAIGKARQFCQKKLAIAFPALFENLPPAEQRQFITERLHRPLRVCGMVRNEGEPGGGPFWIDEEGGQSRQIVEFPQIDASSEGQKSIWKASTHFNPVDLVCGMRDYRSEKFDLGLFTDPTAVVISEKIEKGRHIKVLEHPGLWNGAMARWNTVFVEVPLTTFNPVKTIDDLLRPQHLSEDQ